MRRVLPLFLVLFTVSIQSKADCDPAFTFTTQGDVVHVQATNTGPHLYHSWRADQAPYAYGASADLHFYIPGTFYIVHRVVDSITNCEDSVRQQVVVSFPINCDAQFTATRDSIQWTTYTFRSTSTYGGGYLMYEWKVDGSVVSYNQSFTSTLNLGNHNVCLNIHTTAGCNSSICRTLNVSDILACHLPASFSYYSNPYVPMEISFLGSPFGDSLTYRWNFGDGYSSTQQNPVHVYNHGGSYDVRFIIHDTINGCFDTAVQNIQVYEPPSTNCAVTFTYELSGPAHNVITLAPHSNQVITSQTWLITSNGPYDSIFVSGAAGPTYTFHDAGYYLICLYATTDTGCIASDCDSLYIDSVSNPSGGRLPSYPNPATSSVSLRLHLDQDSRISVTVYNMQGNVAYRTVIGGHSGNNSITIPVQQLNSGQYFIEIQYGNQRKRSTFQKF